MAPNVTFYYSHSSRELSTPNLWKQGSKLTSILNYFFKWTFINAAEKSLLFWWSVSRDHGWHFLSLATRWHTCSFLPNLSLWAESETTCLRWKATFYGPDTGLHALPTSLFTSHGNPHIKRGIPSKMLSKHLVHGKASKNVCYSSHYCCCYSHFYS